MGARPQKTRRLEPDGRVEGLRMSLLVPRAGIEPARREAADFESAVSTSSTIRAALHTQAKHYSAIDRKL